MSSLVYVRSGKMVRNASGKALGKTSAPTDVVTMNLVHGAGGTALPFVFGQVFKQGDVPTAANLGGDTGIQVDPWSYWDDGSLQIAIVSGRKTLASGNNTLTLRNGGSRTAGSALGTADLKATGLDITIATGGTFGTAQFATTDWDSPFYTDAAGPELFYATYRKQIGADPHLVAWVEVFLFADGRVAYVPSVENGYTLVASPTNKSATFTCTVNGTTVYNQATDFKSHTRSPLINGSNVWYWFNGADAAITPMHDKAYLMSSKMVPNYRASVSSGAAAFTGLVTTYAPFQQGNFHTPMGDEGYQSSIGLLPQWDVLRLCSTDTRCWKGVIFNAYSAGRYSVHYRDENTNKPIKFSDFPFRCLGAGSGVAGNGDSDHGQFVPDVTGGSNDTIDVAHLPCLYYFAFLLTGRRYFSEGCQMLAGTTFMHIGDTNRNGADGRMKTEIGATTPRGMAWAYRTLSCACTATKDGEALKTEYRNSIVANVAWNHGKYVAQTHNTFGYMHPYEDYQTGHTGTNVGIWWGPTWEEDFIVGALGWSMDVVTGLDATTLTKQSAFFAWKAQSIVGRLGGTAITDFLYRDAAPYTIPFSPSDSPDFNTGTGPWYADWGAVYAACYGVSNPGVGGDLQGGNYPAASSYWGNLQMAIAYAVDNGVAGALTGYNRMINQGNWSDILSDFNTDCVYSNKPRSTAS